MFSLAMFGFSCSFKPPGLANSLAWHLLWWWHCQLLLVLSACHCLPGVLVILLDDQIWRDCSWQTYFSKKLNVMYGILNMRSMEIIFPNIGFYILSWIWRFAEHGVSIFHPLKRIEFVFHFQKTKVVFHFQNNWGLVPYLIKFGWNNKLPRLSITRLFFFSLLLYCTPNREFYPNLLNCWW